MLYKILISFFVLFTPLALVAQEEEEQDIRVGSTILDDTTKNIFGPTTTRYFFYKDFLYNTGRWRNVDTTVFDLHRFSHVDFYEKQHQDLGVIGTAIRPVYYQFPGTIGLTTGFNVYDLYYKDAGDIKFYNTLSPFTNLKLVLGGLGRATTDISFARNIDYRSNVGFNYHGIFIDKQIERARRGDRNVENVSYNFHGNYQSKDGKYRGLAAFLRSNHEVEEYGGVRIDENIVTPDLFFADNVQVRMSNTSARDLRREYFLYHEYQITDFAELYHEFRKYDQRIDVKSAFAAPDQQHQPDTVLSRQELLAFSPQGNIAHDFNDYDELSNKIGVAGTLGNSFYKLYYQHRIMNFDYRYITPEMIDTTDLIASPIHENLAGAMIEIGQEEDMQLLGQLDYANGGFYNIYGRIGLKFFYGSIRQMKRKPSYVETAYRSTFNEWALNPDGPVTSELDAGLLFKPGRFNFNAGVKIQRLTDYIYFKKDSEKRVKAFQNDGTIAALMPHIDVLAWFGQHWLMKTNAIYSLVGGDNPSTYPVPDLFTNFQFSYNDISFEGNLEWQLGFDLHWKSPYFAPGYDPLVQQFFVQREFETPNAPQIDVFLNTKINRARIFVKYNNLFELINSYGYIPTPFYPGQVATFDFGFTWAFYD